MRVIMMEHWANLAPLQAQLDALCQLLQQENVPDNCVEVTTDTRVSDGGEGRSVCYTATVVLRIPPLGGTTATKCLDVSRSLERLFDHVCDVQWPALSRWMARMSKALVPFAGAYNDATSRKQMSDELAKATADIMSMRWKTA